MCPCLLLSSRSAYRRVLLLVSTVHRHHVPCCPGLHLPGGGGEQKKAGALVTVEDIVSSHWAEYGRNYYTRYDYEGVETKQADAVMDLLKSKMVRVIFAVFAVFI